MDPTPENLRALAEYLLQTLNPDPAVRKAAEKFLSSVEGNEKYAQLLLHTVGSEDTDTNVRLAAAIAFKNLVKKHWRRTSETSAKISDQDRTEVKKVIVSLMLRMPAALQKQLSDAISVIGSEDFPEHWKDLIPEMIRYFTGNDFNAINGVLQTAHSLFKRYRHEFKSQELWKEIKYVLGEFAESFNNLFLRIMQLAGENTQNKPVLKVLFSSLLLICKVFYSLICQELPDEFAEAKLEPWMNNFHLLLTTDNKLIDNDDDDEPGTLELIKSQICECASLFAQNYDEDFRPHLPKFVDAIWHLLVTTDIRVKHDVLVSNAIAFLASVAERPGYKDLFAEENTLRSICEKVVVPNMYFRDSDEELFEDNPEEYVRQDLEGSDVDTRRFAACNLVRALCRHYEAAVMSIFTAYVNALLQEHAKGKWKAKDTALYLISALAMKSKTSKHGATKSSEFVNVSDVFVAQCLPDLQAGIESNTPVLQADALRYLITFRSILSKELLVQVFPLLVVHLRSPAYVVHTYAACSIEKLLIMKNSEGRAMFSLSDISSHQQVLLTNLLSALKMECSAQNEYIMKALLRAISFCGEQVITYQETVLAELVEKLRIVSGNPSKPQFNHYLFECISCLVNLLCQHHPNEVVKVEQKLFPIIEAILVKDVVEFLPYVFQVLSQLLELRPLPVPTTYTSLFPLLLTPVLWEHVGNIPPMVRLLQALLQKGKEVVANADHLNALLGVFQKLIASKTSDHQGFYLLNSILECLPATLLSPHLKDIFILLFQRMQSSKTTKFVKGLLVFFCLFASQYGGPALIQTIDSIQPNFFAMVIEKLFIPDAQKVSGPVERKICAVGITKILTESPAMLAKPYLALWNPLLKILIELFELPEDDSTQDDEHFIDIEDAPGYQTTYCQLAYAGSKPHDPLATIPDAKNNLVVSLQKTSQQYPGTVSNMISQGLDKSCLQYLQKYLQDAGVTI